MTNDEAQALVQKHAAELGEHFDSVRIFVTWPNTNDSTNTQAYDAGSGNFYAQLGHVHEWLEIQREYQRLWAAKKDSEE